MNGKGSDRRPKTISKEEYDRNWERIFGEKVPYNCPHEHLKTEVVGGVFWKQCTKCGQLVDDYETGEADEP